MSEDWYRSNVWSTEDVREFESKLMRANVKNRAQYLRIQAYHLAEASLYAPALQLLDRMLTEYPDDFNVASAHHQRAEILLQLNKQEEAIISFQKAMEAQRMKPNIQTNAYLEFAWFVATTSQTSLFDEAIEALDEFGGGEAFPILQFRYFGSLSIIHAAKGDMSIASIHAKRALAAMDTKESGFRYHKYIGLVRNDEPNIIERLKNIAAS